MVQAPCQPTPGKGAHSLCLHLTEDAQFDPAGIPCLSRPSRCPPGK